MERYRHRRAKAETFYRVLLGRGILARSALASYGGVERWRRRLCAEDKLAAGRRARAGAHDTATHR